MRQRMLSRLPVITSLSIVSAIVAGSLTLAISAVVAPSSITPTSTVRPSPTATPSAVFASSTPLGAPSATPSIIEVTPPGGQPTVPASGTVTTSLDGYYMPFGKTNVRRCPLVNNSRCPVLRVLTGSVAVRFYAQSVVYPQGDVWLCLDAPPAQYVSSSCASVVAYIIGGKYFGSAVFN